VLPFEVAAVILTIAVVAAVMLTLRRRVGAKHQNPGEQSRVRPQDRLRMIKMKAEAPAADAAPGEELKS
jgi:NADH-quinone oxidoreductase subunit J